MEVLNIDDLVVLVEDDIHYQHVYRIIEVGLNVNSKENYYLLNNYHKFGLSEVRLATQEEVRLNKRLGVDVNKEFIEVSAEEALNLSFKNEDVWVKFRNGDLSHASNTTRTMKMFQDLENSFYIKLKPINLDDYKIESVSKYMLSNPNLVSITFSTVEDAKNFREDVGKYLTRKHS